MKKRYAVVLTYDNAIITPFNRPRFRKLEQAQKELARQKECAWHSVISHANLLGKASFKYKLRLWDYVDKTFVN